MFETAQCPNCQICDRRPLKSPPEGGVAFRITSQEWSLALCEMTGWVIQPKFEDVPIKLNTYPDAEMTMKVNV
jgi:hypothetical protein